MRISTSSKQAKYYLHSILASFLIGILSYLMLSLSLSGPTIESPHPIILFLLVMIGYPILLVAAVASLIFLAWIALSFNTPLLRTGFYLLSLIISLTWYVIGWKYGVKFQGLRYVISCLAISLAEISGFIFLIKSNSLKNSNDRFLMTNFIYFAWLCSYAFPYFGENM